MKSVQHLAVPLLLAALGLATFSQAIQAEFVRWDDHTLVLNNPRLVQPTWASLAAFWSEPSRGYDGLYTPIAYTWWWLLARLFGLSGMVFHIGNILLHVTASVLVYAILRELFRSISWPLPVSTRQLCAFLGTVVFLVHPLQAEAVCWVSGMNNVLCAALGFFAVWLYLVWLRTGQSILPYAAATAYILALLAKPSAITFPLIAVAIGLLTGRQSKRAIVSVASIGILGAIPVTLIATNLQQPTGIVTSVLARPLIAMDSLGFYLAKLAAPIHLSADYGRTTPVVLRSLWAPPYILLSLAVIAVSLLAVRRTQWPAIALAAFSIGMLPVSGLSFFNFQNYSNVADRYTYIPMLGVAIFVAWIAATMRSRLWLHLLFGVAVLAMVTLTFRQVRTWRDTLTFGMHAAMSNPDGRLGNGILAGYYLHIGKLELARVHAEASLNANVLAPDSRRMLAEVMLAQGDYVAAAQNAVWLIEQGQPTSAHFALLVRAARKARITDLVEHVATATLRSKPDATAATYALAWYSATQGNMLPAQHAVTQLEHSDLSDPMLEVLKEPIGHKGGGD